MESKELLDEKSALLIKWIKEKAGNIPLVANKYEKLFQIGLKKENPQLSVCMGIKSVKEIPDGFDKYLITTDDLCFYELYDELLRLKISDFKIYNVGMTLVAEVNMNGKC